VFTVPVPVRYPLAFDAGLTREGDDRAVATALTVNAQKAVFEAATPEVALELAPDERRQPRAIGVAGRLGEEGR
jgi:hypothetical protein